jgi:predicted membrane channel-forming protein YqfA (hemolysin III family)
MTKNPIYNALAALVYIIAIVLGLTYMSTIQTKIDDLIMPIIMLSLLVLSVSVMVYIFGYQPLVLFLDNKRKEAISLFLKTVGIFGGITLIIIVTYLLILT